MNPAIAALIQQRIIDLNASIKTADYTVTEAENNVTWQTTALVNAKAKRNALVAERDSLLAALPAEPEEESE